MRSLVTTILFAFSLALMPFVSHGQSNPYLDMKKKNRPSVKQRREDAKHLKRQKKLAKKQMRHSQRSIRRADRRRAKGKVRG